MPSRDVNLHPFSEEVLSQSIHMREFYNALLKKENINSIPISTARLYGEILSQTRGKTFFINWLDVIYGEFQSFRYIKNRFLREIITLLTLPIFALRCFQFFQSLRTFLLRNHVYFFCHDIMTFSRSPIYRFLDSICRPLFLKYSKCVFFAEDSARLEVEKKYGLRISSTEIVHLGSFVEGKGEKTKAELRREYSIPEDAVVLVFAGTVRKNHRDLSYRLEKKILDEGLWLIRGGRGHYRRFSHSSLQVFGGYLESETLEALITLGDYVIIPSEQYLTSGIARLALELETPVIGPSFGSIPDMCAGCFIDYRDFSVGGRLSDVLPAPNSKEYGKMVDACHARNSERSWQKECAKLVRHLAGQQ
jgi:hypothetical protein